MSAFIGAFLVSGRVTFLINSLWWL
jgi:hypothetical protein